LRDAEAAVSRNLVLLGMMGAGKSTVAVLLGERLGRQVVDTDIQVEHIAGRPVAEIFAQEGEAAFRRVERLAIDQISRRADQVISVGGGAVLDDANVVALRSSGVLIELRAPADTLAARLTRQAAGSDPSASRPLLVGAELAARVAELSEVRAPRYAQVADHIADATASPVDVSEAILAWAASVPGVLLAEEQERVGG
jgi:shikimate kinase